MSDPHLHYRAQHLDRRLYGVCSGIIESNNDPEHEGRVKLRFPWLDNATVSDWCRVVQPYAGQDFGAVWIPENQMEVLVAFVHGDMTEPVVIGGLYNGRDKPPAYRDEGTGQDIKMFRTRAGHEIRLDDTHHQQAVQITTAGNHAIVLDDQHRQVSVSSAGGHQITLDDAGQQIEIAVPGGKGKVTIDALGNITLEGTAIRVTGQAITLSAQQVSLG